MRGKSALRASKIDHKPNYRNLATFLVFSCSVYLAIGFFDFNNVIADVFKYKYQTTTADEIIIADLPVLGQAIAAGVGGQLIQYGRRRVAIIGLVGACLCGAPIALGYGYLWMGARLSSAFFYGLAQIATIRYLNEYMPLDFYGTAYSITALNQAIGTLILNLLLFTYPTTPAEIAASHNWQYLVLLGPAVALLTTAYLLLVQRNEAPKFYLMKNRRE